MGAADDDDDEIPPEIKAMMELTEGMHSRPSGLFGGQIKKKDRQEESHEDIMKRLNSLGEEIGERHD